MQAKCLLALGRIFQDSLDLLFPRDCLITGEPVADGSAYRYLSTAALSQIFFVSAPACKYCGQPLYACVEPGAVCANCRDLQPLFAEGRTLFLAKDGGRQLIHALKYQGARYLLADLSQMMAKHAGYRAFFTDAILVPVPLFPRRERQRGYNQALLIAKAIAKISQNCDVLCLLRRVRDTPSQTCLSRERRISNVKNAFAIRPHLLLNKERRHIIIDDVFTTGSTLNACALALKEEGFARVDVATLSHG